MALILLVDDEEDIRLTLSIFLTKDGHGVKTAADGDDALRILKEKPFDILITDIFLSRMNGMDLMSQARLQYPNLQVIVMTGEPTFETAAQAVREGAYDYLPKPVTGQAIRRVVLGAARIKGLNDENQRLVIENKLHREQLQKSIAARTEEIRQGEERLSFLVAGLHAVVWEWDPRSRRFTFVGGMVERLLGYPPAEWHVASFWQAIVHPDDKHLALGFLRGELPGREDVEFRLVAAGGNVVWVTNYITPPTGRDGIWRGVIVDVTRRKLAGMPQ